MIQAQTCPVDHTAETFPWTQLQLANLLLDLYYSLLYYLCYYIIYYYIYYS
jgi:hypothetical protein